MPKRTLLPRRRQWVPFLSALRCSAREFLMQNPRVEGRVRQRFERNVDQTSVKPCRQSCLSAMREVLTCHAEHTDASSLSAIVCGFERRNLRSGRKRGVAEQDNCSDLWLRWFIFNLMRCVLLVIALSPGAVRALDPARALSQYMHESWTEAGDLPLSAVSGIAQTRDGYLWFATQDGLVRFDGVRFEALTPLNTPVMQNKSVADIALARDGSLWVAIHSGGVLRLKSGRWTAYGLREGLPSDSARSLLADSKGRVWVGTSQGLSVFKGDGFSDDIVSTLAHVENATPLLEDRHGAIWFGSGDGVYRWRNGVVDHYTVADGLPHQSVLSAYEDAQGRVWIGTRSGLAEWRDRRILRHMIPGDATRQAIFSIGGDSDHNLWLGTTSGGLIRYRAGRADGLGQKYDFSHVTAIFEDAERNLWIGTFGGGLHRLHNGKFIVYGTPEGLSHDATYTAYEDAQGAVWIGTYGSGLNRLKDGVTTVYTSAHGLRNENLGVVVAARNGDVWIATQGGLHRLRGGRIRAYGPAEGISEQLVTAIVEDRTGKIWVGNSEGLHRLEGDRFRTYGTRDGLPGNFVVAIIEARAGGLWIGTYDSGLVRMKDGYFITYRGAGLDRQPISCLHEDADGVLWIGTYGGGLIRAQGGRFNAITSRHGLFDDTILNLLEDARGRLWMSSNRGIFRVDKAELNAVVEGRSLRVHNIVYGKDDGMRSAETNGGGGGAAKHRDGRLWFPTQKGVAVIDPEHIETNTRPPPVAVERLRSGNRDVGLRAPVVLPPGSANLAIHYSAPSFVAAGKVAFRYRLEGYQNDWVDAGTRRAAYYTNLGPGDYRFQVLARNHDGVWSRRSASLAFSIRPHFYQTTWFILLCASMILFGIWGLHRLRLTLVLAKVAVFEERARIAQEIHDGLTQQLGGIAMQLEAARERIETADNLQQAAQSGRYVQRARSLVEASLEELHRLIWALRPARLEDADLAEAIGRLIAELDADSDIGFGYRIEGAPAELPRELEATMLRIAQEALFNATRHGQASRIDVVLDFRTDTVSLIVKDNGCGFDPQSTVTNKRGRFGMRGMDERMRRLGGALRVQSGVGVGTTVRAVLPRRPWVFRVLGATIWRIRTSPPSA
ncbi:MAG: hypothetical protein E6Q88_01200 [Lysobacteraceae bacterium]|nr:MAG: hypothetical protein E6Q88_01200 [Xanthomonadaceae bacterium]